MSAKIATQGLPITGRRALTTLDNTLLDVVHSKASFIFTEELFDPIGQSPPSEQRAFRKTFDLSKTRPSPTSATVVLAADDDFAFYLNGVLVHPADGTHDDDALEAYSVPLPVVDKDDSKSLVLGFRVINHLGGTGLLVAVQVHYPDNGEPDVFYTGADQSWFGQRLFQEHWEQPWFSETPDFSVWRPAQVWNSTTRDPKASKLLREEVVQFGRLDAFVDPAPSGCPATCNGTVGAAGSGGVSERKGLDIGAGAFAGALIGTAILALALGALFGFFATKKRLEGTYKRAAEPSYAPASDVARVGASYQSATSSGMALYQPSPGVGDPYQYGGPPSAGAVTTGSGQISGYSVTPLLYQPERKPGRRGPQADHQPPNPSSSPPPPPFAE
ncbi:hypothetical protein D9611_011897 [Ephemerocybe angulata]|uniref:Uncharacterized protein n=1 Tax=Ephemerocybe angulata TaxID=980116 RepID=A0A8H5FCG7_9AGAR|nr:hypothetical protein D9611_011897 [Tulosesus angulatus]